MDLDWDALNALIGVATGALLMLCVYLGSKIGNS